MGQTIKLTCKITGSPKPVVGWFKGEKKNESISLIIILERFVVQKHREEYKEELWPLKKSEVAAKYVWVVQYLRGASG